MVDFAQSDSSQSGVDARIDSEESVVQSVLKAVQTATVDEMIGGDPNRDQPSGAMAPPLYEFINPDALDALCRHARDYEETARWTTTFRYADTDVSVTSAGTITVEPGHSGDPSQREHGCPRCEDANVDVSDDRFVVGATLQCPQCGHEWDVSF